jgi:hydrogenase maturation protein HypF
MQDTIRTYRVKITGLVQGVGFRPFIYRLAKKFGLRGTVDNRNDGVLILVQGTEGQNFIHSIRSEAPPAAAIENIQVEQIKQKTFEDFRIIHSRNNAIENEITEISPDIAVCASCLEDMKKQPHRIAYPFINCTNCGPRFSIIKALPYDRPNTTMDVFPMCAVCAAEYGDVEDRRFHAQPVACNHCGPHYALYWQGKVYRKMDEILQFIAQHLAKGGVLAAKGLGGFNLICDALNEDAVAELRRNKHRDGKPLAVLFADLKAIELYAPVSNEEKHLLQSWRRPIVLLPCSNFPNPLVTMGFHSIGAMLPYMPFHYQLFEYTRCKALVYTSANLSGEPIIKENNKALEAFGKQMPVLMYNREIHNRTDDSVAMIADKSQSLIRRSRGYAPGPVRLPFPVDGILATGAELVNCFCLGRTSQAILSQHIGDLKNAETLEFFEESIERYKQLYKFEPKHIVCDFHPDYRSSRYAENSGLPLTKVQHHHAHMASVMAEHALDEKVLGIIWDGTGYGTDGKIWGGEFFVGDYTGFERCAHFDYVPIPGGDKATEEPWRSAVSYLYKYLGKDGLKKSIPFLEMIEAEKAGLITQLIDKKLNCPESSSAGRLFDAVSALLGLCLHSSFHAEAPMRLEDELDKQETESYPFAIAQGVISWQAMFHRMLSDLEAGIAAGKIATRFHNTLINIALDICMDMRERYRINKVVLSGGSFQNRYLSERLPQKLRERNFEVFTHQNIPANDGGLALGQLAIAAKMLHT